MTASLSGPEVVISRHEFIINTLGPQRETAAVPPPLDGVADEILAGAAQAGLALGAVGQVVGWWDHVLRGPIAVEVVAGIDVAGSPVAPDADGAFGRLSMVAHDEQWWDVIAPAVDIRLFDIADNSVYAESWSGPSNDELRQWQDRRHWRDYDQDPEYVRKVLEHHPGSYPDSTAAALEQFVASGKVTALPPSAIAAAQQPAKKRGIFRR